ncbi:helix-turn-helix transcriptional regulator [Kribbella ginsengisoli]|uniref:Helix-turn-helix transcriptional regulator n=1 Tax=Kribbella ginsengisoli TaxID=363865 RepID=A0ABP6Y932_9ACTN
MSNLGEYLKVRRERLRPEDVGLPGGSRRRVPGLRREEVALLAGISVEYYLRLEQGRDQHPSDQVLDSLSRALQLDADSETYLKNLTTPTKPVRRRAARPEQVSTGIQSLIDSWPTTPALVQGRYLTTLAANRMAVALSPFFAPGVNTIRAAFLEPEMREFYLDWDEMTAKAVAYLRSIIAPDIDDPQITTLIGELSLHSDRFRTLWAKQDVRQKTSGTTRFNHPQVGPLTLNYEKLALPGAPNQMLITYHATPGTPSHDKLQLLAHL